MARVEVEIEEVSLVEDDDDPGRPGVQATCSRCDHTTESFGVGPRSRVRCLMLMKEECPNGEENYYVDPEDGGRPSDPVPKPWWEK